ncbi:MAG TPA: zf-HC2 domain-containing protein [Candidatus Limnocylindrales bacterium]|nr:zf-HC2 domain-containing protein [Candidatus Limnocylindrales bacterium]
MNGRRLHREFLDLAAARLDEPLAAADQQRLEAHMATCGACREQVAGYESDRAALRGLREPAPPRDLWARTSAALDREQAQPVERRSRLSGGQVVRSGPPGGRTVRGAFAAALAMLVIVAVVGSGFLPGFPGPFGGSRGVAEATPFEVEPRILAYFSTRDGEVGVYMGRIARVCPEAAEANCPTIEADVRKVASFTNDFVPQRLAVSPDGRTGAVVGTSPRGGAVYALQFPDLALETPEPTGTPSTSPTSDLAPTGSSEPPVEDTPSPLVPPTPGAGVEPLAIIEHVIVVGETPAYSADGTMLAFSAMPADSSSGPDIYLWRSGSEVAVPVTSDHGSIFASWAGGAIVGSRGVFTADGTPDAARPSSFLLDPATLEVRVLARSAWRPVVDPTGRFVIYWDGTLEADADGLTWRERRGGLYLAAWQLFDPAAAGPAPGPTAEPAPTGDPSPGAEPSETAGPTDGSGATPEPTVGVSTEPPTEAPTEPPAEPTYSATEPPAPSEPGKPQKLEPERDYLDDPILSWEIRWSPDGEWFGAWIGDRRAGEPPSPGEERGALTVGAVDRETGRVDRDRIQLDRAPAGRGFALGDHRIAWVTLPEPGGSSEVRLLVWTEDGRNRGVIRSTPGGGSDTLPAL